MKFVDQVRILVKAGDGGNGAVAFRREKYIDKGGPSGGDGGNGGSVIFETDPQLTTLLDFRFQQHHKARSGQHGMGSDMNGRAGDDLVLKAPLGTLVIDDATGTLLKDLSTPGEKWVVAQGGRGGWGNMNFATSTRQTPRFAQDGTLGEEKNLVLELKLLADVGLLGFPNAGKSTFITRISHARPKVADYPFTTLVPNLGVVEYRDRKSFVVADIPGLIEGASEGHGLGHQFLRHVERCRVLVHLVDLSAAPEGRDPVADFDTINRELQKYSAILADKPQLVVANKLDLPHAREALPAFVDAMTKRGVKVFELSGATGDGAQAVLDACARVLFAPAEKKVRLKGRHETDDVITAAEALETITAKKATKKSSKGAAASAGSEALPAAETGAAKSRAVKSSAAKPSDAGSAGVAAKSGAAKSSTGKANGAGTAKSSAGKANGAGTAKSSAAGKSTGAAKSSTAGKSNGAGAAKSSAAGKSNGAGAAKSSAAGKSNGAGAAKSGAAGKSNGAGAAKSGPAKSGAATAVVGTSAAKRAAAIAAAKAAARKGR